jgi:hypothetical protein
MKCPTEHVVSAIEQKRMHFLAGSFAARQS